MRKLEIIDFLKGYSIFTIVIYHLSQYLHLSDFFYALSLFGGTGAHLFILLSGLTLTLSYQHKKTTYLNFLKRRFQKVYLPYFFIILISATTALVFPVFPKSLYAFFANIFLFNMFDNTVINTYGDHIWFIATIIQLYLVFFILLKIKEKLSDKKFLLLGLILSLSWSLIIIYLGKSHLRVWNSFFLQYLWEFMLGIFLATYITQERIRLWQKNFKNWYYLIFTVIGIGFYGFLAIKFGNIGKSLNDIPAVLGYSSLALFIFNLRLEPLNKFFVYTGTISYSLYLTHFLVIKLLALFLQKQEILVTWPILIIFLIFCYFISLLYFKLLKYFTQKNFEQKAS